MKIFSSTSTKNKISIDVELRELIKIDPDKHVIMLVGAPDGLERHYQNVLDWGGSVNNLTIVDISEATIKSLQKFHAENLSQYGSPSFIVSDLNALLETWDRGSIGVIDFDGTGGIVANYHLRTLLHAERLKADYLIIVASPRIQDDGMITFGSELPLVNRRVYIAKEEQETSRQRYSKTYTQQKTTFKSTHSILNDLVSGRGHSLVKSQAYKGVSPMVLSVIKLSKVDPQTYYENLRARRFKLLLRALTSDDPEIDRAEISISKELDRAEIGINIESQLEYISSDRIQELFKCKRRSDGKYFPSDEWYLKYEPEEFKFVHPARYRKALCKNREAHGQNMIRPASFTKEESDELVNWYKQLLVNANDDYDKIKKAVYEYATVNYRTYEAIRATLSNLGLWMKLYRKTPRRQCL